MATPNLCFLLELTLYFSKLDGQTAMDEFLFDDYLERYEFIPEETKCIELLGSKVCFYQQLDSINMDINSHEHRERNQNAIAPAYTSSATTTLATLLHARFVTCDTANHAP